MARYTHTHVLDSNIGCMDNAREVEIAAGAVQAFRVYEAATFMIARLGGRTKIIVTMAGR